MIKVGNPDHLYVGLRGTTITQACMICVVAVVPEGADSEKSACTLQQGRQAKQNGANDATDNRAVDTDLL